jgi:hypothetical protein
MTTSADGSEVPLQATSGVTQDTSEEVPTVQPDFSRVPGIGASTIGANPILSSDPGEALRNPLVGEMNKLRSFLMQAFPREMHRTNITNAETPVDVAIRLLKGLGVVTAGERCSEEYCNLPANHDGSHGFVNYQPR